MVCTSQKKSVSINRNEAFAEKDISTIWKNCFLWQEKHRKGFRLAEECLSFKLSSSLF